MSEDKIPRRLETPDPIDLKIYTGGWGRTWSLRDVIEGDLFKMICMAEEVAFTRYGFHEEISQPVEGPHARTAALPELLEFGSLGMESNEEKDGVLYVSANWNFAG